MTRTSPGRLAACLATGVLTLLGAFPAAPAAAEPSDEPPLQVSIDTLSPAAVPVRGPVTVTGQITNTSSQTWTDLKVYMLTSATPMTSPEELATASTTDPATQIGSRLYQDGLYDEVGDLAPGESVPYTLSVKRSQLGIGTSPGVYWLGVHVLGAENGARDTIADGRARTFIPEVPSGTPAHDLALVMPLTEPVQRGRTNRLRHPERWRASFGGGRLERLVRLSNRASGRPLTWLLDPAVLDAARSVAAGNPPLNIAPTDGTADPAASATPSPSASPSPSGPGQETPTSPSAQNAANWLQMLRRQAPSHAVLTLPYGDLDVAAALHKRQAGVYRAATALSAATVEAAQVAASPVVAPANGLLPASALRRIDPGTPVLLGDGAYPDATTSVLTTQGGGRVALADTAASSGGPTPDRYSALAVRQRILSEAALHALSGSRSPLVVSTPRTWDPGPEWNRAGFFQGLDQPWLHLVDLPTVLSGTGGSLAVGRPDYPARQARREVPFANLLATRDLARLGNTFATLLTRNDTVDDDLAKTGLLASSSTVRDQPDKALQRVRGTASQVRSQMQLVHIEGPSFVAMSSEEGPIQITVVNGLDEQVTVGVHALTRTHDVTVSSPDPVTLGPGNRGSMRLTAKAGDIGVHSVTLVATDSQGHPLGSTAQFTVRTSKVGLVIWAIMGVGGAVLVAAIVMRMVRRVKRRKSTPGPLLPEGEE